MPRRRTAARGARGHDSDATLVPMTLGVVERAKGDRDSWLTGGTVMIPPMIPHRPDEANPPKRASVRMTNGSSPRFSGNAQRLRPERRRVPPPFVARWTMDGGHIVARPSS